MPFEIAAYKLNELNDSKTQRLQENGITRQQVKPITGANRSAEELLLSLSFGGASPFPVIARSFKRRGNLKEKNIGGAERFTLHS